MGQNYRPKVKYKRKPKKDPNFVALQAKWYKKLKDEGFEDIERISPGGHTNESIMEKSDGNLKKTLRAHGVSGIENRQKFYSLISNFLAWNPKWTECRRSLFIMEQYEAGLSYRKILKLWAKRYPKRRPFSVFVVFQTVRRFLPICMQWNRSHPEGLEFKESMDLAEQLEGGNA